MTLDELYQRYQSSPKTSAGLTAPFQSEYQYSLSSPEDWLENAGRLRDSSGTPLADTGNFVPLSAMGQPIVGNRRTEFEKQYGDKWGSMSPLERAKFSNPDGKLIGKDANKFGIDVWERGNQYPYQGMANNNEPDSFMDMLGLYLTGGIAGLGALANTGMFSSFGIPGWEGGAGMSSALDTELGSYFGGGGDILSGGSGASELIGSANADKLNSASILEDALDLAVKEGATSSQSTLGGFLEKLTSPIKSAFSAVNQALGTEKNPFTMRDVIGGGANYLLQSSMADKYADAANTAAMKNNPLDQAQRGQYQQQLSQLLTNPQQFYATNPVVQAQLDLARQQFLANTGKMGTGGTQFNDYLKNVQNVAAGTFNDQANLLSRLGGFDQGSGYAGNVYANLMNKSLSSASTSMGFLPDTIERIFGDLGNMNNITKQKSPSGTSFESLA